jgi:hypothetical protein
MAAERQVTADSAIANITCRFILSDHFLSPQILDCCYS